MTSLEKTLREHLHYAHSQLILDEIKKRMLHGTSTLSPDDSETIQRLEIALQMREQ